MTYWLALAAVLLATTAGAQEARETGPQGHLAFSLARSELHGVTVGAELFHGDAFGTGAFARLSAERREDGYGISASLGRGSGQAWSVLGTDAAPYMTVSYDESDWDDAAWTQRVIGAEAGLRFEIAPETSLRAGVFARQTRMGAVGADVSTYLAGDVGSFAAGGLTLGITHDARSDARHGFLLGADLSTATGERHWTSLGLSARAAMPLGETARLTAHAIAGALESRDDDGSAIWERAVLSGGVLRGFAPAGIGPRDFASADDTPLLGNRYAALNLAAIAPVADLPAGTVELGAFWSAGALWSLDDPGSIDDARHWRASRGVTLALAMPSGTVELVLADPYRKREGDETRALSLTFRRDF